MGNKVDVKVELFYSGGWHDITATDDVYTRDVIRITRGRPDGASRMPPGSLSLSIKNVSGKYSPRVPTSALYGLIGRNTPIRVSVGSSVRCVMEVESWPQRWSVKGNDVWAPITANGILRRITAPGTTLPELSALRRAILADVPTAYWPMEDGPEATQAASGIDGGEPLRVTAGVVAFLATAVLAGSTGACDASAGRLSGTTGQAAGTVASWEFEAEVGWDTLPPPNTIQRVVRFQTPGGDYDQWGLVSNDDAGTVQPYFRIEARQPNGTGTIFGASAITAQPIVAGETQNVRVRMYQSGADVKTRMWIDGIAMAESTLVGITLKAPTTVELPGDTSTTMGPSRVSHLAVWVPARAELSGLTYRAANAHAGDTAADRISRLCDQNDIPITIVGTAAASAAMGAQRAATLPDLLNDAAEADGGPLFETRDALGLTFRVHSDLYNQTAALALSYSAGSEVAPDLAPVEDTDATANDVTVTRAGGASARVVQDTGPLNVKSPSTDPDGVNRYKREYTLYLADDDQCIQHASWIKHEGTWDEARYPVVNLDLTAMAIASKTALIAAAAGLNVGDRFTIANPPAWLPPETIVQHAQGFTETIESHHWEIATNATPALPYEVLQLETGSGNRSRIPTGGSTLAGTMTTTATSRTVTSPGAAWIDSATYAAQFPFDIMVAGERMTVTAIVGTSSPQTFTVTRSVNGVVKTHAANEPVQLFHPPVIAL